MYEIEEFEKMINNLKRQKNYSKLYMFSKNLHSLDFISDEILLTYGQCLILAGEYKEAKNIFEKLYNSNYKNYFVLASLLFLEFENCQWEGALYYVEELKNFCNKKQLCELIPFEIYLYKMNGINSNEICKTNSAIYLRKQIDKYNQDKAIKFINYQNNMDFETNIEDLFYGCLNHVCKTDRGIQFNSFCPSISFFDRYYMNMESYSLVRSKYKYVKISTLPFSNHICMIEPKTHNETIKQLVIKKNA